MSATQDRVQDQVLVQECLAGSADAWQRFYDCYQDFVVRCVRRQLGARGRDDHLVDEIAQNVWSSLLVRDMQRLRSYDPERGRLCTLLAAVLRQEVQLFYRSRKRRQGREVPLPERALADRRGPTWPRGYSQEDFVATLSAQEKNFFENYLLGNPDSDRPCPFSPTNVWKLRQRVRDKLSKFL